MNGPILLKQLCTVGAILLCLGVSGCRDDVKNIYKGDEEKEEPEKVPNDFDFSTHSLVDLKIKYNVPQGYKVAFEAYTRNPISLNDAKDYVKDENMLPFLTGATNENGEFSFSVKLAGSVKEVYVYSSYEGVPMIMKGYVQNNAVTVSPDTSSDITYSSKAVARADDKYYYNWKTQHVQTRVLGTWNNNGIPQYIVSEKHYTPTDRFNEVVTATRLTTDVTAQHYSCNSIDITNAPQGAHIFLNFISHNNSQRKNALAYYTYTDDIYQAKKNNFNEYINSNLIIAFPNTLAMQNEGKRGEAVQLKYKDSSGNLVPVFPNNTHIGFVLLVDAFQEDMANIQTKAVYSFNDCNIYNIKGAAGEQDAHTSGHPGMVSYKADDKYVLAFEDQPWNENVNRHCPADFADDIFTIEADPISAIPTPPDGNEPEIPESSPVVVESGILAFEDNWPDAGDYDLNDVIISYIRTFYYDGGFNTVALKEKYQFINNGATYTNAFGYVIDNKLLTTNIKSVKIESEYKCAGQGLDKDLATATIMLFDNGKKLKSGKAGTIFTVTTVFNEPVVLYNGSWGTYNPFIVVNGMLEDGRKEVHLPKRAPTLKGKNLFGTGNDLSVPDNNLYYVREGIYPFALDLAGDVNQDPPLPAFIDNIPEETKPVDTVYPDFINWVKDHNTAKPTGKYDNWYIRP